MRPKTAAEATEVHKHCSRTRVQKVNREVRRKMKAAREVWIQVQCKNIEKGTMSGNGKEATTPSRLSPRPNSISQ